MEEREHTSYIVSLRVPKELKLEVDEIARLLKVPATNLWRISVAEKCASVRALCDPKSTRNGEQYQTHFDG